MAARSEPITLIATSRSGDELPNLELGNPKSKVDFHKLDVTSQKSIETLVEYIKSHYKHLDILINNAGAQFEEADNSTFGPEVIKKTFAVSELNSVLRVI